MLDWLSSLIEKLIGIVTNIGNGLTDLMNAGHQYVEYIANYTAQLRSFLTGWIPPQFLFIALSCIAIDILFIILGANNS